MYNNGTEIIFFVLMFTVEMTMAGKKLTVEPFRNPPKIIPVCIQYDYTIDANLELTVHVYDLVIS